MVNAKEGLDDLQRGQAIWEITPEPIKAVIYAFVLGNGGKVAGELGGWSVPQAWALGLGSVAIYLIARTVLHMLRPVRLTSEQKRLRELAVYFSAQANEAITELRDKQGNSVQTINDAFNYLKAAGRWFGRNEYLASTVHDVCPNEVDEFLVHAQKLAVSVTVPVMKPEHYIANHTKAHIEAKVMKLRALSKALFERAGQPTQ